MKVIVPLVCWAFVMTSLIVYSCTIPFEYTVEYVRSLMPSFFMMLISSLSMLLYALMLKTSEQEPVEKNKNKKE